MKIKNLVLALTIGLVSTQALADEASVTMSLKQKYPELPSVEVKKSQAPGLYQVKIQEHVAYTDEGVNYLFLGGSVLTKNGTQTVKLAPNLNAPLPLVPAQKPAPVTTTAPTTEPAQATTAPTEAVKDVGYGISKLYSRLPFEKSVKLTYGNGSRQMAIFVDPDCPYCQALDKTIVENAKELNVTMHLFYFPLKIHPYAQEKAEFLWCQTDKEGAWKSWMAYTNTHPIDGSDDNAVQSRWANWKKESGFNSTVANCDKNVVTQTGDLARGLGLNSTPVMLFKNSIQLPGLANVTRIKEGLDLSERFPVVPQLEDAIVVPGVLSNK